MSAQRGERQTAFLGLGPWIGIVLMLVSWQGRALGEEFVLTRDGRPAATIVTAAAATDVAAFAAQELQYHIRKISGAILPIKSDADKIDGPRILVGASAATERLGLKPEQLDEQEYVIHFADDALVLMGKDAPTRDAIQKAKNWAASAGKIRIPPPAWDDEQATSYAVHDFLERCCDVRWYGPGELEMVLPHRATLVVQPREVRRAPAFVYRRPYGPGRIIRSLWNKPSRKDVDLFWARLRIGGEKYACNHSLYGYYDRFWEKTAEHPAVFEIAHHDWFAEGYPKGSRGAYKGMPPQMCYSNQGLVDQVVADADAYFSGAGAKYRAQAAGRYFAVVPMDNHRWCKCSACQAQLTGNENADHIASSAIASDYWFGFVNKVAGEVATTHPDKFISTLAYSSYAYPPRKAPLAPNVTVQLCLHVRNWWAPSVKENDLRYYRAWVSEGKNRPLYVWLYYCYPEEIANRWKYHCFPGFGAHTIDRQIKMFARDGIRGAFLNGVGEQVDAYVTFKLLDDPSLDVDAVLNEFFTRYYGAAAEPMKRIYLRIEDIYQNPGNYPEKLLKGRKSQLWQHEETAWKDLGTEARMAELGVLMDEATRTAVGKTEKVRVALFRKGVWDYMVEGRKQYLAKQKDVRGSK